MCGIIACVGEADCVEPLLNGLERLEYRGYDSAGVAVRTGQQPAVTKLEGEVANVRRAVESAGYRSRVGIAHTRWSTHGPPTDENAHPHTDCTGEVAVVHNGIIDNYQQLREELSDDGHRFTSETDTEVIPHLIERELRRGVAPERAFGRAIEAIEGSYAVAAVIGDDESVYAARSGSPLVLGVGEDRSFLASDVPAFLEYTERVTYLEDGDRVRLDADGYEIRDVDTGERLDRPVETVDWDPQNTGKGGYDHYMFKEINEQPAALRKTIRGRVNTADAVELEAFPSGAFESVDRVHLVGMGTSYHAALYAQLLLNRSGVQAQAFQASSYTTTRPPIDERTLTVAVTQSGETADTLQAIRFAAATGARTLAVTNVVGSSVTRECDESLFIRAGPEIGVAATKTFSSQVAALSVLTARLVEDVTRSPPQDYRGRQTALAELPGHVQEVLDTSTARTVADRYRDSDAYFFIGRWVAHPVALEGALKFKEITYEHAEGFDGAELKHGPLALVTPDTPVFAIFTGEETESMLGNVKEVQAREAPVVAITSDPDERIREFADDVLTVPETHPDVAGILANVQLQLVAYHAADYMDRDIDKPRNLAKSVTVE
jgi:glucosamine--fructose-6-phosphate aminotransferase (isomerizing)